MRLLGLQILEPEINNEVCLRGDQCLNLSYTGRRLCLVVEQILAGIIKVHTSAIAQHLLKYW